MGALDLPVQLWGAGLDVDVLDALVREVPMKQRLERRAAVGAYRVNAEEKHPGHLVREVLDFIASRPRGGSERPAA